MPFSDLHPLWKEYEKEWREVLDDIEHYVDRAIETSGIPTRYKGAWVRDEMLREGMPSDWEPPRPKPSIPYRA